MTGHGYLHRVATKDVTTELVLRERDSGTEYHLPVTHTATPGLGADQDEGRFVYDRAGFDAVVDLTTAADGAPLADGLWDISLVIGAQGLSREVRIGSNRSAEVPGSTAPHIVETAEGLRAATLYTTKPYGNLTLDLGERKHEVLPHLSLDEVRWAADVPTELEFTGRCTLADYPHGALNVVLNEDQGGSATFTGRRAAGDEFVVRVPVTELPLGTWHGELRLGNWTLPLPRLPEDLPPAKWHRRARPWYAKPAPGDNEGFALLIAKTDLLKAITKRAVR